MSRDPAQSSLEHDLRGALSAVQMNLQTLDALETAEAGLTPEKRLAIIRRAMSALTEAVSLAERLGADVSGSPADPG